MRFIELRRAVARQASRPLLGALALAGAVGTAAGCNDVQRVEPSEPPITDPTALYMRLTLDHPAINLSTAPGYDAVQVTATPRDALGNAMAGLGAPTFRSTDTTRVRVTAEGVVTAVALSVSGVNVIAELTVGPVTHADTALVRVPVSRTPPQLAALSIDPPPSDSTVWGIPMVDAETDYTTTDFIFRALALWPEFLRVVAEATTATSASIPDLTIEYTSLDRSIATVDRRSGTVIALRPGTVRMVARTFAYGVAKADTATFTVTMPAAQDFFIQPGSTGALGFVSIALGPSQTNEVRIAPYGIVGWSFAPPVYSGATTYDSVDVVFDDPTHVAMPPAEFCDLMPFVLGDDPFCGSGNLIVPFQGNDPYGNGVLTTFRWRQFPVPGVYPFHSERTGATGVVVVTNDPT